MRDRKGRDVYLQEASEALGRVDAVCVLLFVFIFTKTKQNKKHGFETVLNFTNSKR